MSLRSAHEIDAELRRALRAYHRAEQRSVLCFAEVVARKLYRELGHATIFEYGAEALGFSRQRTYGFLRLAEAIERLPELRTALTAGEIGWTKAREIIKVAGPKSIGQWLAQAKRLTRRDLEERVRRARQRRVMARAANPSQRELTPRRPARSQGAPVSEARMDSRQETLPELPDESPEPVTYRLTPIQFARYEALVERLHKSRAIPVGSSREEILLAGLEALVAAAGGEVSPRGNNASPCKIVVSECPICRRARVETNRGAKQLPPQELEALKCDAIIEDGKGRQRHAVPPRIRCAVLKRD